MSSDARPICRFCGERWALGDGVDATVHYCDGCSAERRRAASDAINIDGKQAVVVGGHMLRVKVKRD